METANMGEQSKILEQKNLETSCIQSIRSSSRMKKALLLLITILIMVGCLWPSPFTLKGILDCCPHTATRALGPTIDKCLHILNFRIPCPSSYWMEPS